MPSLVLVRLERSNYFYLISTESELNCGNYSFYLVLFSHNYASIVLNKQYSVLFDFLDAMSIYRFEWFKGLIFAVYCQVS